MTLRTCLLLSAAFAASGLLAADWPQWRGPNRDGKVEGPAWPAKLDDESFRQEWRVELAPSYSGPIVVGDRVFTTETAGKKTEIVRALDRATGKELWKTEWPGAISVPFFARANGDWIRATPAADKDALYVAGIRDVLVCLDQSTGKERWRFDFAEKLKAPEPAFGFVSSPLLDDDAVYVQAGASFVKLNKRTGEVIWRTLKDEGGMWGSAFASPSFAKVGGQRQVLVQTREKLSGVAPDTGTVLWEQPIAAFRGMNILTPIIHQDILYTSTYGGRTIGYRLAKEGDKFTVNEAWRHKAQGYMTTPVIIDGVAYNHLRSQRMNAVEVATGRELWTSDRSFGKYMSLVAQGDRILALDERGTLFLIRANKERFEVLAERKVSDSETWAHLTVVGDQLFIRDLKGLSAFRWK